MRALEKERCDAIEILKVPVDLHRPRPRLEFPHPVAAQNTRLYAGNSIADDITVTDLDSLKVLGDICVGPHVHGIAFQADSVAVPIRDRDSVDIADAARQKVVKVLPVKAPHNVFDSGSNRYMFVSSMGDHAINMIDLETMDYAASIPVGGAPRPYVVTGDGRTNYVALSDLHGLAIVNIPEKKVVRRVEMPAEHPKPHEHPYEPINTLTHGLALSPDEQELWVTSLLDDALYVDEVKSQKIVARAPTGSRPNWVAFSSDGKYVCVSNAGSDDVSSIDGKARREVTRLKVGGAPKRLVAASVPPASAQKSASR